MLARFAAMLSPQSDPLAELRRAVAQLRAAEGVLAARRADIERVRQLIDAADEAALASERADDAAAAVAKQHALRGAAGSLSAEAQQVMHDADVASRTARQAKFLARGAGSAMDELREAEQQTQRDLNAAEEAVRMETSRALLAQVEPELLEMRELSQRYNQLFRRASALALLLDRRWGTAHPWRRDVAGDSTLTPILRELAIGLPDESDSTLRSICEDWLSTARALRAQAEATDAVQ